MGALAGCSARGTEAFCGLSQSSRCLTVWAISPVRKPISVSHASAGMFAEIGCERRREVVSVVNEHLVHGLELLQPPSEGLGDAGIEEFPCLRHGCLVVFVAGVVCARVVQVLCAHGPNLLPHVRLSVFDRPARRGPQALRWISLPLGRERSCSMSVRGVPCQVRSLPKALPAACLRRQVLRIQGRGSRSMLASTGSQSAFVPLSAGNPQDYQ